MLHYVAVIHKEPGSDYGISFPDFPGCVSAAATLDEAFTAAQEALELHVEGMLEDGEALPDATALDAIVPLERATVCAMLLVNIDLPRKAPVRINATFDPDLLSRIDAYVEAHGTSRSAFLAEAARQQLPPAALKP